MSKYPPGQFIGYRKFAVDREWLEDQKERRYQKRRREFAKWSEKWITVTRLKSDRLWTDSAIRKFLGEPKQQDKYKVFAVEAVRKAERTKAFKEWLAPRLEKKLSTDPYFQIKKIGTV